MVKFMLIIQNLNILRMKLSSKYRIIMTNWKADRRRKEKALDFNAFNGISSLLPHNDLEQEASHFHFTLGLTSYVAVSVGEFLYFSKKILLLKFWRRVCKISWKE